MSDKDDGGQAFPTPDNADSWGMTLRDYFAAHAPTPNQFLTLEAHCAYRYAYADNMIKERKK